MLKSLMTILMMQIQTKRTFRNKDLKQKIAFVAIRLLITILITIVCYFALGFFRDIMSLSVNYSLLLFIVGFTQLLSIFSNMFALTNDLYFNKDTAILFAFPLKNNQVFISKMIIFYIKEFGKNLNFIIPVFLAFGFYLGLSVGYVLNLALLIVLLPLFPVLIGALLSIIYSSLKKLFNRYPYVKSIVVIALVVGFWMLISYVMGLLPRPLRLLEIYNMFMQWFNGVIAIFDQYLLFYINIVNILFAGRAVLDYAIIVGVVTLLTLFVYFVSIPFYFDTVSSLSEFSKTRKSKKEFKNKTITPFKAFLLKEFRGMYRNTDKLTEYAISLVSFPFVLYIMNTIFTAINTNNLGDTLVIGFNIIIGLMILISANTISVCALSSEGEEFVLVKTSPTTANSVIWAKILFNIIISTFVILLGMGELMLITEIPLWELALFAFVLICLNSTHIIWSMQIDLLNPLFANYSNTKSNNNNPNVAKSILIGVALSFFFGLFAVYFMADNFAAGWVDLIAVSVLFLALRIYLLKINMQVYFKRLEL